MNKTYPKTFTHRDDHNSSVVVMNAEQESQLPAEFLPAVVVGGLSGSTALVSAGDLAADVMLTPEYAQLLADREKLEQDRAEFAEHVANTMRDLTADRNTLDADRARLVEGYTADKAKQDADRIALDNERAAFELTKTGAAPDDAAAPADTAAADTAAGPAKRVRVAKPADEA
jgi:hypothetical protein